jgi:tetratricopeptide (TPR) repeat protein
LQRYEEAIQKCQQLLVSDPTNLDAKGFLGWLHYEAGDYKESANSIRKALEQDSNALWIQCNLGLALLHLGEVVQAREAYERASEIAGRRTNPKAEVEAFALADLRSSKRLGVILSGWSPRNFSDVGEGRYENSSS